MNVNYAKTALYAYSNLQNIADQIDDIVEKKALSSMCDYSLAITQCERIVEYTQQKDTLFALKIRIDEVLEKLDFEQIDLIEYKYFKRKPKEYFDGFDFESRAYFRKQTRLIERVSELFEKNGTTDEWFEQTCLKIDFFRELLKRTIAHENSYSKKSIYKKPTTAKVTREKMRLSA